MFYVWFSLLGKSLSLSLDYIVVLSYNSSWKVYINTAKMQESTKSPQKVVEEK